jgi:hypothetical protein
VRYMAAKARALLAEVQALNVTLPLLSARSAGTSNINITGEQVHAQLTDRPAI